MHKDATLEMATALAPAVPSPTDAPLTRRCWRDADMRPEDDVVLALCREPPPAETCGPPIPPASMPP